MPAVRNVLVAGAGLAGASAAIHLATGGIAVELVDISPAPGALGSGITLQGNALRELRRLGVWDDVRITHGEGDRQIPVEHAHRSYAQAVASPKRELRVFTAEEGGAEHIGLDHLPYVSAFIADWVADTFAELAAAAASP